MASRVTDVEFASPITQYGSQSMPPGVEVTRPAPEPEVNTDKEYGADPTVVDKNVPVTPPIVRVVPTVVPAPPPEMCLTQIDCPGLRLPFDEVNAAEHPIEYSPP